MKNLNILKKLIREELARIKEGHNEMENYMFFQNVKSISDATSQILQMDPQYVDSILSDGHQWAVDHIATSADDVSEVVTFLKNRGCMQESKFKDAFDTMAGGDLIGALQGKGGQSGYIGPPLGSSKFKKKGVLSTTDKKLQSIINSVTYLASDELSMLGFTNQEKRKVEEVDRILKELVVRAKEGSEQRNQAGNAPASVDEKKGFTSKYDSDPKLKGKQKNLPDALQDEIINSK